MFLATTSIHIIPDGGVWDQIFRQTWVNINVLGLFGTNGFRINLAGLIIVLFVSIVATNVTERLAGEKPGRNVLAGLLLAIFGAYVFANFVKLPFDTYIEDFPIIAGLIGAIVFGVFFVLIKKQMNGGAKKA